MTEQNQTEQNQTEQNQTEQSQTEQGKHTHEIEAEKHAEVAQTTAVAKLMAGMTPGRVVHVRERRADGQVEPHPAPAIVLMVEGLGPEIHVRRLDTNDVCHLNHRDHAPSTHDTFWEWMPYQEGQKKETQRLRDEVAKLEAKNAALCRANTDMVLEHFPAAQKALVAMEASLDKIKQSAQVGAVKVRGHANPAVYAESTLNSLAEQAEKARAAFAELTIDVCGPIAAIGGLAVGQRTMESRFAYLFAEVRKIQNADALHDKLDRLRAEQAAKQEAPFEDNQTAPSDPEPSQPEEVREALAQGEHDPDADASENVVKAQDAG